MEGVMVHGGHNCCHHAVTDDDAALRALQRRLGVCALLLALLWFRAPAGLEAPMHAGLATVVVLWGAGPFFISGVRGLNMFTLVSLSIGAAWLLSGVQLALALVRGLPPPMLYFETAATVTVLVLLGQVLEQRARSATRAQLRDLYDFMPPTAYVVQRDGTDKEVPVRDVRPGDLLRVRCHARVPVDGVLCEEHASIDASWVSGEAMPRECNVGDRVVGGTLNGPTACVMRAEGVGEATVMAQVRRLVSEAQNSRARVQRLADRVSVYFVPVIVGVAVVTVLGWWLWGDEAPAAALVRGATVCIVACPCALGLATPVAVTVAVGRAARRGMVIRHVEALETLATVDTLVLDKTGTLTMGRPDIVAVVPVGRWSEKELVYYAASLEQGSTHPLATALMRRAQAMALRLGAAQDCVSTAGVGLQGRVDGHALWLGKPEALGLARLAALGLQEPLRGQEAHGQTLMLLLVDDAPAGLLAATDEVRPTTPGALAALRDGGLNLVMLTGDNQRSALKLADTLNISEVHADMSPQDKWQYVKTLQEQGRRVAVAGDGINDAPALAQADVGIALARDAHIAMPQAGINLMHADLRGIHEARVLSAATVRVVRQNLALAFAYNIVAVPVAAGLFEAVGVSLSPVWAGVAMSASSLAVVGNALRLRRVKK